jgi:hypothetical protein
VTRLFRQLSIAFAAGAVGALALGVFLLILRDTGVLANLGIRPPPVRMPEFLYGRMVWGGIWALLFVLPVMTGQWLLRGVVVGVLASLAAIFYFNPAWQGAAFNFVALIFVANAVWGIVAAGWYRAVGR